MGDPEVGYDSDRVPLTPSTIKLGKRKAPYSDGPAIPDMGRIAIEPYPNEEIQGTLKQTKRAPTLSSIHTLMWGPRGVMAYFKGGTHGFYKMDSPEYKKLEPEKDIAFHKNMDIPSRRTTGIQKTDNVYGFFITD